MTNTTAETGALSNPQVAEKNPVEMKVDVTAQAEDPKNPPDSSADDTEMQEIDISKQKDSNDVEKANPQDKGLYKLKICSLTIFHFYYQHFS